MRVRLLVSQALLVGAAVVFASSAQAQTKMFHATAAGTQEVPPVTGAGKATGMFTLNTATKELTWSVTYSGLSSDATAAHIHGPAASGANAGVEINLAAAGTKSPIEGKATLTDAQIADLEGGKTYLNIHTANNKGGEIRGQIAP
jgi:Cu/Zn superoxide dismutase